jgi:hypothetical protein
MKYLIRGGLLIAFIAAAILFFYLDPSEHMIFPRCFIHSATGYYCPGCGSQRAIHNLLHLNLAGVMQNNMLFLIAVPSLMYHYLQLFFNKKFHLNLPNVFYMKATPVVVFILIVFFWIVRNLPFVPFTELAPGQ